MFRDTVVDMLQVENLSKRYGDKTAVSDANFTIRPGMVTGFLGPNGAGKSTTMRLISGLDSPTSGRALVDGQPYAQHRAPLSSLGALLDARAVHSGRSARNHLLAVAATCGVGKKRVNDVLAMTGLESVAKKRVGGFSLGMGQRLGIAAALLGDPANVIFDEPVNGLDIEGVRWVRDLTRHLANEGRVVFLSSHLMSEVAQVADHVIVIGRGRILADKPIDEFVAGAGRSHVVVRSPDLGRLTELLAGPDVTISSAADGAIAVSGLSVGAIGDVAARNGIALHELSQVDASLEDAYVAFTGSEVEYKMKEGIQ